MSKSVFVIGEALVDRIVDHHGQSTDVLGGGPFNAARVLGRLDIETWFLSGISQDDFGARVCAALEDCGVRRAVPERSPRPTGVALARVDRDGTAAYEFELEESSCTDVTVEQALSGLRAADEVAVVHLGTLALVLTPLRAAALAVVDELAPTVLCFIDPNCRPALVPDTTEYRRTLEQVFARADVIKISTEDAEFLWPDQTPLAAARALQRERGCVVLLTEGERGVTALGRDFERHVAAPRVAVADTVGAGDAFGAGFIAWWLRSGYSRNDLIDEQAVVKATRAGVAVAAWTVQHRGAAAPTWGDIPEQWLLD